MTASHEGEPRGQLRAVFVHAHPDDESITTGATIAALASAGWDVTVLTCTLGEAGEVMDERFAELTHANADQLGGYRFSELSAALGHLGANTPRLLGGLGTFRDSGMALGPSGHPVLGEEPDARRAQRSLSRQDLAPQVAMMAAELRALRPDLVVTYDPRGGYGHPDHVRCHTITMRAVAAVDHYADRGDGTPIREVAWTVVSESAARSAFAALEPTELPQDWRMLPGAVGMTLPDDRIDARVATTDGTIAKIAALREHRTQLTVNRTGTAFALTNRFAIPVVAVEEYQVVRDAGLLRGLVAG